MSARAQVGHHLSCAKVLASIRHGSVGIIGWLRPGSGVEFCCRTGKVPRVWHQGVSGEAGHFKGAVPRYLEAWCQPVGAPTWGILLHVSPPIQCAPARELEEG